ncbi:MAG TPA: hypothetical protein VLH84_05540 [Patescibacteria group bacterium]|nr:hypothetical protein [Patescibacteria group bacterium]
MKPRHIVLINVVFFGFMVFSAGMVYQFMTGKKPLSFAGALSHRDSTVTTTNCSSQPALSLSNASAQGLHKLEVYQQACHSFVTGTMMVFVGMPVSQATALHAAEQDAAMLKQFAHYGVRPLVTAEPTDYTTGVNIDFGQFAAGKFTIWLNVYFQSLKAAGITDQQMGIWNPFPEANLPYWANNQPQFFAPDVNIYVSTLHKYFPKAPASIMLNSATYQTTDFNWQSGEYDSLLPYIKGITPGSIAYAGLEGFPWVSPAGGTGPIINAAEFLDSALIGEAADYLGTKNVWLNTGTFSKKYALDPTQLATVPPQQRKEILSTIDQQALILQKQGYRVAVNLFSQDKSKASEETDWSYWSGKQPFSSLDTPVLTDFISELNQQKIDFWLFDN